MQMERGLSQAQGRFYAAMMCAGVSLRREMQHDLYRVILTQISLHRRSERMIIYLYKRFKILAFNLC